MKKFILLIPAILVLSACQGSTNQSETSEKATQTTTQSMSHDTVQTTGTTSGKMESSRMESSSEKGSTSNNSSESTTTSKNQQTALEQLKSEQPSIPMPQEIPVFSGQLNIAAAQTKQGFSILYYDLPEALVLNAKELNQETPIATYLYQGGFASSQEAINVLQPFTIDTGGQKVDLGYNITAYQQGAAGSSILEWQEGNWRIRIRASNIEGQDPIPLAKEVVNYLEKASLPAPEKYGKIVIEMNDHSNQSTQVSWQEPTKVYTVTHKDTLAALKMAVSMES